MNRVQAWMDGRMGVRMDAWMGQWAGVSRRVGEWVVGWLMLAKHMGKQAGG